MRLITKYLIKQLLYGICLVLLALVGLDLILSYVNELRLTDQAGYSIHQALLFSLTNIPKKLGLLFPWASLLGTLLVLGKLVLNNELTVLRAIGVSLNRIVALIVLLIFSLSIIVTLLGELYIFDTTNYRQLRTDGIWTKQGDSFVHIDSVIGNKLHGVTKYVFQDTNLSTIYFGKIAYKVSNSWQMHDVVKVDLQPSSIKSQHYTTLSLDTLVDMGYIKDKKNKHLDRESILTLRRAIQNLSDNGVNTSNHQLAIWSKLFNPFSTIGMLLVAIPSMFTVVARSKSLSKQIIGGIFIAFGASCCAAILTSFLVIHNTTPLLATIIPLALIFAFGYSLLLRAT